MTEPAIRWSTPTTRAVRDVSATPTADPRWDGSATEKQMAFAKSLAEQLGLSEQLASEMAKGNGPSKARASALIERMLALKAQKGQGKATTAAETSTGLDLTPLAGGHYAAEIDGVTKFFRIDRPTEGRWAGWAFVKLQASDDLYTQGRQRPGESYVGSSQDYLRAIVADEKAAYALYGQKIGRCGVCGRTLTDETSRAYGIGPVCRERWGI